MGKMEGKGRGETTGGALGINSSEGDRLKSTRVYKQQSVNEYRSGYA